MVERRRFGCRYIKELLHPVRQQQLGWSVPPPIDGATPYGASYGAPVTNTMEKRRTKKKTDVQVKKKKKEIFWFHRRLFGLFPFFFSKSTATHKNSHTMFQPTFCCCNFMLNNNFLNSKCLFVPLNEKSFSGTGRAHSTFQTAWIQAIKNSWHAIYARCVHWIKTFSMTDSPTHTPSTLMTRISSFISHVVDDDDDKN